MIIKSGVRPGQDRESGAFCLKTKKRTWVDLNKFFKFPIFLDDTRPNTSWKLKKQTSLRLINYHWDWGSCKSVMCVQSKLVSCLKIHWHFERLSCTDKRGSYNIDVLEGNCPHNKMSNLSFRSGLSQVCVSWSCGTRGVHC